MASTPSTSAHFRHDETRLSGDPHLSLLDLTPALDSDVPEIVSLMNLAYRGADTEAWNNESYIKGPRTTEAAMREEIAAKPAGRQLVWRREPRGPILATVWVEPTEDDVWYLGALTVHPGEQNGGLGRDLLAAAESWVGAHGGHAIKMTVVHIRAGLLAWYQRRGYALTDETQPFPYGDGRFGTPQRDDLYFVVLKKQLIGS